MECQSTCGTDRGDIACQEARVSGTWWSDQEVQEFPIEAFPTSSDGRRPPEAPRPSAVRDRGVSRLEYRWWKASMGLQRAGTKLQRGKNTAAEEARQERRNRGACVLG